MMDWLEFIGGIPNRVTPKDMRLAFYCQLQEWVCERPIGSVSETMYELAQEIWYLRRALRRQYDIHKDLSQQAAHAIWRAADMQRHIEKLEARNFEVLPAIESDGPGVYFVQAEVSGLVKIGVSTINVMDRIPSLQTGSPEILRLVGHIATGAPHEIEAGLHRRFRKQRSHGEWFRPNDEMIQLIKRLNGEVRYRQLDWASLHNFQIDL